MPGGHGPGAQHRPGRSAVLAAVLLGVMGCIVMMRTQAEPIVAPVLTPVPPRAEGVSAGTPPAFGTLTADAAASLLLCTRNLSPMPNRGYVEAVRWDDKHYINKDSIIMEIGGYTGGDARKYLKLGPGRYFVFEPVAEFFEVLRHKLEHEQVVRVLPYGLGGADYRANVSIPHRRGGGGGGSTSTFRVKGARTVEIQIRNATAVFHELGLTSSMIDLIQINCEGCEYEVLEAFLFAGLLPRFRNIQVQFHYLSSIPNMEMRYCLVAQALSSTHRLTHRRSFVWENWQLQ